MTTTGSKEADPNAVAPAGPASDPTPLMKEGTTPIMSDQSQSVSLSTEPMVTLYAHPAGFLIGGKLAFVGGGYIDGTEIDVTELIVGGTSIVASPAEFGELARTLLASAEPVDQIVPTEYSEELGISADARVGAQ